MRAKKKKAGTKLTASDVNRILHQISGVVRQHIPEDASVEQVLAAIDEWARYQASQGRNDRPRALWSVLSALRGPDFFDDPYAAAEDGAEEIKWRTASVIRAAALPKMAAIAGAFVHRVDSQLKAKLEKIDGMPYPKSDPTGHYTQHQQRAARALLGRSE